MILILGGLGFVGANTAQALLEVGEDCVLTQHHTTVFHHSCRTIWKRIVIEPLDIMSVQALRDLGRRYPITGIIHLATGGLPVGPERRRLIWCRMSK